MLRSRIFAIGCSSTRVSVLSKSRYCHTVPCIISAIPQTEGLEVAVKTWRSLNEGLAEQHISIRTVSVHLLLSRTGGKGQRDCPPRDEDRYVHGSVP